MPRTCTWHLVSQAPKLNAAEEEKEDATPPEVKNVLHDYEDLFPDELPAGAPPSRGFEHKIELEPGAKPP